MLLAGKLAVVTGGARGIGAAIVRSFREAGAHVAIVDVVEPDLDTQRAAPGDGNLWWFPCDVTDGAAIELTCARIESECGQPAILMNDAGGSGNIKAKTLEETSDAIWDHVMNLNMTSTLRFCRRLAPGMRAAGYGRIINMSSVVRYGIPSPPAPTMFAHIPYVVSKAAIAGFTAQLARELGPDGITANAIAPGLILPGEDARVTKNFMTLPDEVRARVKASIPVRRYGIGEDIAALAVYLASEGSAYMTGQTIDIDGGV